MAHHPNLARVDKEMNFTWGTNNPDLMVNAIALFQDEHPVTEWSHTIDLSRNGFITLIARRRATPFLDVAEYLAHQDGKLYLKETGQYD